MTMTEPRPLTPRQRCVLDYIHGYTRKNGYQPSYREIMKTFGWHSPNATVAHLDALAAKGWIERPQGEMRCIKFLFNVDGLPFRGFVEL